MSLRQGAECVCVCEAEVKLRSLVTRSCCCCVCCSFFFLLRRLCCARGRATTAVRRPLARSPRLFLPPSSPAFSRLLCRNCAGATTVCSLARPQSGETAGYHQNLLDLIESIVTKKAAGLSLPGDFTDLPANQQPLPEAGTLRTPKTEDVSADLDALCFCHFLFPH